MFRSLAGNVPGVSLLKCEPCISEVQLCSTGWALVSFPLPSGVSCRAPGMIPVSTEQDSLDMSLGGPGWP